MTVMGDALMDGLSDAGSIPARSTIKKCHKYTDIGEFMALLFM